MEAAHVDADRPLARGRVTLRAALLEPAHSVTSPLLDVTPSPRAGARWPHREALADAPDAAPGRDAFRAWFGSRPAAGAMTGCC